LTAAFDGLYGLQRILLPLLVRVVEFASIGHYLGKPLPLSAVKPGDAYNHGAIRRLLGHGRIPRPNVPGNRRVPGNLGAWRRVRTRGLPPF
jgi:hypothetical protein